MAEPIFTKLDTHILLSEPVSTARQPVSPSARHAVSLHVYHFIVPSNDSVEFPKSLCNY
jgi:hypothetical protein